MKLHRSSALPCALAALLAACGSTPDAPPYVPSGAPVAMGEPAAEPAPEAPQDVAEAPAGTQVSEAAWTRGARERMTLVRGRTPQNDPLSLSIWNDPSFRRWVLESYAAETEIEPGLTEIERDELERVLELMAEDEIDKAVKLLEKERGEGASAVFDFTLANIRFQQEEFGLAEEALLVAIEKHPKFRRAWQNLGVIHFRDGEYDLAIPALTKVIELGGANAITYGMLGFAYTGVANFLSAETAYRMAVLMDPRTMDWKQGLSFCLFKQGRYAETAALCDAIIAEDPERTDAWMIQANAWLGLEKPMKAAENYELVDRLGESSAASLGKLGDIYVSEQLFDLALGAYLRAFEKDPEGGVRRGLRAAKILASRSALEETGQLVERIEEAQGDALAPDDRKELLRLKARVAVARGADEEQVRVLEEIVELDPTDGQALILLAQHYELNADPEQATFYYERAMNLEEHEIDACKGLGQLLVRQQKYKEALPLLRRALAQDPSDTLRDFVEQIERRASGR